MKLSIALALALGGFAGLSMSHIHSKIPLENVRPTMSGSLLNSSHPANPVAVLDCLALTYPTVEEILSCVTEPSDPTADYTCTTDGHCSCSGAGDCRKFGSEKICENELCTPAGCIASGCTDRPPPPPPNP